jgi:hypothetical protein
MNEHDETDFAFLTSCRRPDPGQAVSLAHLATPLLPQTSGHRTAILAHTRACHSDLSCYLCFKLAFHVYWRISTVWMNVVMRLCDHLSLLCFLRPFVAVPVSCC